jgi:indolepyruvate ferredoxin oxidoreductase beta subunit
MKAMNVYLIGVGGQGIGLLADVLTRACLEAGYNVKGCDTHGLAQRHGTVISHLRIGERLYTPRVPPGRADLIVGLERLEALRAAGGMLVEGGTVVYYDTVYQPIHVRMGEVPYPEVEEIEAVVASRSGRLERVYLDDLADPRMQNVALIGRVAAAGVIPGVTAAILEQALRETVPSKVLDENLAVFERASVAGEG